MTGSRTAAGDPTAPAGPTTVGGLYQHGETGWATGAELVYGPLARALVATSPVDLDGWRVLDAGSGTGAGSRALASVGARPVGLDLAWTMLAHDRCRRPPAVVADLYRLPLRARSLDGVVAPFVLNHVDQPVTALAELAGCVVSGGVLLASTFSSADRPAVKDVIDGVARRHGLVFPETYDWLRREAAPLLGQASSMVVAARRAGLVDVEATEGPIDVGIRRPRDLVAYRFGMPQLAGFLDSLSPRHRAQVVAEAEAEVTATTDGSTLAPVVVQLRARVR